MISPVDTLTPDVLRAGEFIYGQPFALEPGWVFWGINDRLTMLFDLTAWLGGIPDLFLKYSLTDPDSKIFRLALENMVMYIPGSYGNFNKGAQQGSDQYYIFFERPGWSDVFRADTSFTIFTDFRLLLSGGLSYSQNLSISNYNMPVNYGITLSNYIEPVASIGLDWRALDWLSAHSGVSYGETFEYNENRPRKWQATYGVNIAPFYWLNFGFLQTFTIQLAAFISYFPDAQQYEALYIPIYPTVYWQWRW
ncbi:MAG: hypothetical protein ABSG94_09315 [Brevinematales bacterium]|jgi:hypothetical protein